MRNIALIGLSGSGKTTVARMLESQAQFQPCKSGSVCREISRILFGNETRSNLNVLTDALKTISSDILIAAALRQADHSRPILIDSLRYVTDYEFAKRENFYIVRVHAEPSICVERLRARGQSFDPFTDLLHPSEVELRDHEADFILTNHGSPDELQDDVTRLLQSLEAQ